MCAEPVPLTELQRDLPCASVGGWVVELGRRGVEIVQDDLGRQAIDRSSARAIYAEARESEARAARRRAEIEQRLIAADEARRAALPKGIPAGMVPEGVSAGLAMMLADPMQGPRRQSVLEHALENPAGALVYHPLNEGAS